MSEPLTAIDRGRPEGDRPAVPRLERRQEAGPGAAARRPTDREIEALAQGVADDGLAPRAAGHDERGALPLDNIADLGAAGLMGLLVPQRYGGLGGTVRQYARTAELLARACPSTAMVWVMHTSQVVGLVEHGDERQCEEWLPGIAAGRTLVASGTTEPGTGGNFYYCNSAAERRGDGWSISAVKPVVTAARHADLCFIITRADPAAPGDRLSFFIVPLDEDGVERFGEWNTVGMRATESTGLRFTDVALTDLHLLGGPGRFGPVALTSITPVGLVGFAAIWLGAAQAAYTLTGEHLRQRRHTFSLTPDEGEGHTLASYDSVQRQLAEAGILLAQSRAFVDGVARKLDEARPAPGRPIALGPALPLVEEAMAMRVAVGENALAVTETVLRLTGAQAYRRQHLAIERYHRDVLSAQVMAPAPDMLKTILGRLWLGASFAQATRFRPVDGPGRETGSGTGGEPGR